MNGWESAGLLLTCVAALTGVYWAGIEYGDRRGYARGRSDGERLTDPASSTVYTARSAPADVPEDPRPTARGNARLRTASIVAPWMPDDDWRHPDPD